MKESDREYLRRRLDEFHFRGYSRTQVFSEANLPDPSKITPMPTVVLPREKINEFRDWFFMLSTFVECVLGKKEFCAFDMAAYLQNEMKPQQCVKCRRPVGNQDRKCEYCFTFIGSVYDEKPRNTDAGGAR